MKHRTAFVAAALILPVVLVGCATSSEPDAATQDIDTIEEVSPASILAALDETEAGLERVPDYEVLLDQLSVRCGQSPDDISGLIIDAITLLTERGEKQTHLWLMDEMVSEIPEGEVLDEESCEVLAGIIVLAEVQ